MGEAPQAGGGRQASAYPVHQDSTKRTNMDRSPEKTLRSVGAPFYSQFDSFPHASRAPCSQHGNSYPSYLPQQQPTARLDMSSMSLALSETSSSTPKGGYSQPAPSYANGILPSTMEYQPQVLHYGSQGYQPNVAIHVSMPRTQTHTPLFAPHHYYNSYNVQQSQGQHMPGYAIMPGLPYGKPDITGQQMLSQSRAGLARSSVVIESAPSYPRGPPRKPKQSGHALWVGNLPPGTTIGALKDHFSREATHDIESLFLISKSNCAFVNYKTEAACLAAMERFHDSRFQGVRLVCRPRRGTPTGSSSPTTPVSIAPSLSNGNKKSPRRVAPRLPSGPVIVDSSASQSPKNESREAPTESPDGTDGVDGVDGAAGVDWGRAPEKYFIVKSLTLQDLEASVRNGVWATQSHNEVALNHAYESADKVFLVFSANKSGEYFGYARMLSPITSDLAPRSTNLQPKPKDLETGPRSIPTPATKWAPKGRIVDDSARGTIFWEAENSESEEEGADGVAAAEEAREEKAGGSKQAQEWGKSFKVEWISTNRLPFYRTRGLRNPWNENREIKIARDGTEIEPSIGQRLVQMFHRPASPPRGVVGMPAVNNSPMAHHFP